MDFIVWVSFIGIIAGLIISLIARRQTEEKLKESKIELQKSLNLIQVLLNTIPSPIYYKNKSGEFLECNIAFEELTSRNKRDLIGKTAEGVFEEVLAKEFNRQDLIILKSRGKQSFETSYQSKTGQKSILISKAAVINHYDELEGIVGVITDITEQKKNQHKLNKLMQIKDSILEINHCIIGLENMEELFNLIVEKAINAINNAEFGSMLILDEDGLLHAAASRGYDKERMKKFSIKLEDSFQWIKTQGNLTGTTIMNNVDELEELMTVEVIAEKKGWEIKSCISTPIIINNKLYGMLNIDSNRNGAFDDEDIEIMDYLRSQIEIAINKHNLYQEIRYLSRYDSLTNIYNRRYFEEMVKQFHKKAQRYHEEFAIVVFDLNNLKKVNDFYGHDEGDRYIKAFVKGIKDNIRGSDLFARFGGDEFIALYFDSNEVQLREKFEGLKEYFVNKPLMIKEELIVCSFSYGIAEFRNDGKTYEELVKLADEKMYRHKSIMKKNGNELYKAYSN